jgi:hypothetical protein
VLNLDTWTSAGGSLNLVFKTPNNGTLTYGLPMVAATWTPVAIPLSDFVNANFDFTAPSMEFIVQKGNAGWPLASSSIRIDNFSLTRRSPAYTGLQTWRHTHFGTHAPVGLAADHQDPDGDGIVNLVEYAFQYDPHSPIHPPLPRSEIVGPNLLMSFTPPTTATGILYSAEWTNTLMPEDWHVCPNSGTPPLHLYQIPATGRDRVLLRLRITKQP